MAKYRDQLPQIEGSRFITYAGMETDLIFAKGIDLPGFASFPLLETKAGRDILFGYFKDLISIAQAAGVGVILEGPTWIANKDRGAALGYSPEILRKRNAQSIALMVKARDACGDLPTVISANIGPRADAYAPATQMSIEEATAYHSEQIAPLAETDADIVTGYTLAYPNEAIGIVRAAQQAGLPVVISFTVETNGQLPVGMSLGDAIELVDEATGGYAAYFMVNCAHPDHFAHVLSEKPWIHRIKGVVANASRCSHAELDQAEFLDDGNPVELGQQLAEIQKAFPGINVLGGCCGTDMRHITEIARA